MTHGFDDKCNMVKYYSGIIRCCVYLLMAVLIQSILEVIIVILQLFRAATIKQNLLYIQTHTSIATTSVHKLHSS